jgi:hypothetical protein
MDTSGHYIDTVSKVRLNFIYSSILQEILSCSSEQLDENFLKTCSDPMLIKNIKKITESPRRESFSLKLVENIEGCRPILRQIWKVSLHPMPKTSNSIITAKEVLKKILNFTSSLPSQFFIYSGSVSIDLIRESNVLNHWEADQRPQVKLFPDSAFKIESFRYFVLFQVEFCDLDFKPKIKEENLGIRPRLFSLEIEDFKEFKDFLGFSNESASPDKKIKQKQLSLITSESFYQEYEIGFNLISSTLPDNLDSEDEDVSQNSFDLDLEVSQNDEDSQVSLYIKKCIKTSQLNLFKDSTSPSTLIHEWLETK